MSTRNRSNISITAPIAVGGERNQRTRTKTTRYDMEFLENEEQLMYQQVMSTYV